MNLISYYFLSNKLLTPNDITIIIEILSDEEIIDVFATCVNFFVCDFKTDKVRKSKMLNFVNTHLLFVLKTLIELPENFERKHNPSSFFFTSLRKRR